MSKPETPPPTLDTPDDLDAIAQLTETDPDTLEDMPEDFAPGHPLSDDSLDIAVPGRRYKMADIARKAGVSTATVSRALTRPDRVHPATRELIHKIAAEAGFRPNLIGRQLRSQLSHSLLILVQDLANPFYPEFIKGAESVARERNYSVMVGNTDGNSTDEQRYADLFLGNRVDGLVLLTGHLPYGISADLAANSPIVLASERNHELDVSSVAIDNVQWASRAVSYLIQQGHRRIGHIHGPLARIISRERRAGYREALAYAGLAHDEALECDGHYTLHGGRIAALTLLDQPNPPTAIFCANDESAVGAIIAARSKGLRVPEDLSIIGFDDIFLAEISQPALTTIHQPRHELGRACATIVIDMIESGICTSIHQTLDCEFIHRSSVQAITR